MCWIRNNVESSSSQSVPFRVPLKLNTYNCLLKTFLFVRRIRGSANMQMAQVPQHGPIFFAHSPREIRIVQMLIPRRLRHVLQYAETLSDGPPPVGRQLFP